MEWKFQNVDPGSLKGALSSCLSGIDHGTTDSLATGISDSAWQSSSKTKLTKLLNTMGGDAYKSLESALESYIGTAGLLSQYKILEKEYKELCAEYDSLKPRLYITKTREVTWYDKFGRSHRGTEKYQVMDQAVAKRMREIESRKTEIESEATGLEKQIEGSV